MKGEYCEVFVSLGSLFAAAIVTVFSVDVCEDDDDDDLNQVLEHM